MARAKKMRKDHRELAARAARGLRHLADEVEQATKFSTLVAVNSDIFRVAEDIKALIRANTSTGATIT